MSVHEESTTTRPRLLRPQSDARLERSHPDRLATYPSFGQAAPAPQRFSAATPTSLNRHRIPGVRKIVHDKADRLIGVKLRHALCLSWHREQSKCQLSRGREPPSRRPEGTPPPPAGGPGRVLPARVRLLHVLGAAARSLAMAERAAAESRISRDRSERPIHTFRRLRARLTNSSYRTTILVASPLSLFATSS